MTGKIPHFSTFSKNYARRFADSSIFEDIYFGIINEIMQHGFIDEENTVIIEAASKQMLTTEQVRK